MLPWNDGVCFLNKYKNIDNTKANITTGVSIIIIVIGEMYVISKLFIFVKNDRKIIDIAIYSW